MKNSPSTERILPIENSGRNSGDSPANRRKIGAFLYAQNSGVTAGRRVESVPTANSGRNSGGTPQNRRGTGAAKKAHHEFLQSIKKRFPDFLESLKRGFPEFSLSIKMGKFRTTAGGVA
jgi:hypothetical protein